MAKRVVLDGVSLTCGALSRLGAAKSQIGVSTEAMRRIRNARTVVDGLVERGFADGHVAYGINTGFGLFADVIIPGDELAQLQTNLIRSHSAGVGEPLSPEETRRLLALRINVLAKGHSGIRAETVDRMVAAFNADCLSVVPSKGTVGASGDLAPLSHLALGLMGEGMMWDPDFPGQHAPAAEVLSRRGLEPVELLAKEGLAMINGTQMMSSLAADAVTRAANLAVCADVACALSVEALKGTPRAFEPCVHSVRPHSGQGAVARRLLALLLPHSDLFASHRYSGKVQDAYSLRCTPQVHGVVHDTVAFVDGILEVELNSATDNPMIFTEEDGVRLMMEPPGAPVGEAAATARDGEPRDGNRLTPFKRPSDTFYDAQGGFVISGGNFHGEYPAKAADFLAIAVTELANISERRLERLVNPTINGGLPAFLAHDPGLDSGFMIAHCTAAALASENKVLCHPSSVDTISTSGAKEDHVSMGGFSARKAVTVVEHTEQVVAIELMAACQALEHFRPLTTTGPLEEVVSLIRARVPPLEGDRVMSTDIDAVVDVIRSGAIAAVAHAAEAAAAARSAADGE